MKTAFALALIAAAISGCAAHRDPGKVYVNILSDPPGAQIYINTADGKKAIGFAPQLVNFSISEKSKSEGAVTTSPIDAKWASGAIATSRVKIQIGVGDQQYVMTRPANAAGLDIDYKFALQHQAAQQSAALQQEQMRASAANSLAIGAAAFQAGRAGAYAPAPDLAPLRQPINCTTSVLGQVARTNCN